MTARLCGGNKDKGCSSTSKPSYKDISRKNTEQTPQPHAYIVERIEKIMSLELTNPMIEEIHEVYTTRAIICRFNGLWPKTVDL